MVAEARRPGRTARRHNKRGCQSNRQGSGSVSQYYSNDREVMRPFVPAEVHRALDIGCAEGNFGSWIRQQRHAEVWGLEFSPEAAMKASAILDRVLPGDAMQTIEQLPAASFDLVVCNDVLEHLAEPELLLQKIKRVLTPGGVIVASIPNVRFWSAFRKIVFRADFPREDQGIFDRTHLRFFTHKVIVRMFSETGFRIQRLQGITPTTNREYYILNALLFGALSDCRYQQYACVVSPLS